MNEGKSSDEIIHPQQHLDLNGLYVIPHTDTSY